MKEVFSMSELEFLAGVIVEEDRLHAVLVSGNAKKASYVLFAPTVSEENKPEIKNLNFLIYAIEKCPLKEGMKKEDYLKELNAFASKVSYPEETAIKRGVSLSDRGYDVVLCAMDEAYRTLKSLGFITDKERGYYTSL